MANARRGEVSATVAGRRYLLCLTLGSLAELEDAFGVDDLGALAARFGSGRLGARDLVRIFGAGLRGAGQPVGDDDVRAMPVAESLEDLAAAVAALLEATFGPGVPPRPAVPRGATSSPGGSSPPNPPPPQPA